MFILNELIFRESSTKLLYFLNWQTEYGKKNMYYYNNDICLQRNHSFPIAISLTFSPSGEKMSALPTSLKTFTP